jgi:hypothetical protein
VALVALLVLLLAYALLRLQPPLIGICAIGLPLLFGLYLRETGALGDQSKITLAVTAALAVGLGTGWAFATEAIWKRTFDDVLGTPMSTSDELVNLIAIPVTGLLLVLTPVVLIRLLRPGTREALDGFVIGAIAALCFTGAGVLTRAAPEFGDGLVAHDYPMDALLALAAIRGVAGPLTAAALGGMVGATLWFRPRTTPATRSHWYSLTSPAPAVVVALLAYLAQNRIDYAWISYGQVVALYAVITVAAVVALRVVLHGTLLRELPDEGDPSEPVACPQCAHVVPDVAFCANCGGAAHGASRTSRADRRADRAIPATTAVRHTSVVHLLVVLSAALAVVAVATAGVSLWLTPPEVNYVCPPDCGRPPIGQPVTVNPRFTSADGAFSVSYPGAATAYTSTFDANGVTLELHAGDGGTLRLFGEPSAGRTAHQLVDDLIKQQYPEATTDYEIPNALVGYQPGYGVVADVFPTGAQADRLRVLVMVAVKHDLALVAAATGPYHEFTPDFGSGHPSGANFFLALDMGKYVNSFMWRGDPVR